MKVITCVIFGCDNAIFPVGYVGVNERLSEL